MGTSTQLSTPVLVFGGAFDPIHRGHLKLADKIQKEWQYEEVWFIPCQSSRYGKEMASFELRMAMIEASFNDIVNPAFKVLDAEVQCNAEGKMYVLAKYLQETYPDAEMDFLIGSDSLQHLDSWYRIDDLRNEFMLLVAQREGYPEERLLGGLYYNRGLEYNMSSTMAREQIKTDGCSPLVTVGTQQIIKENKLYV